MISYNIFLNILIYNFNLSFNLIKLYFLNLSFI